jgi:hypothetical protein
MVDLLFILHTITAIVLLLVASTYLVEFSYRHQNYPKMNEQNKNDPEYENLQKYKNLRFGKAADGAYYAGCYKWQNEKCKSLSKADEQGCKITYESIKNKADDPTASGSFFYTFSDSKLIEKSYKYAYCTNEWFKWNSSRFIPAILSLFFAIIEILFVLEKVDIVKGLTYGFWVRTIIYLAFGVDILGVSGDLGISAGIILLILTLVWVICYLIGTIDHSKIGAN